MAAPTPGALAFGLLSLALACPLVAAATAPADPAAGRVLIQNVTIISPEQDAPRGPMDVALSDGRIEAIAPELPDDGYDSGEIIDGSDRFLTPGLIDSHVHLTMIPGMHRGHEAEFPDIAEAARKQIPRSFLYHGFTTIIDLIGHPEPIATWNAQSVRPHAYYFGGAPVRDGYPTHRIPRPARYQAFPTFLYDPARPEGLPPDFDTARHSPPAVAALFAGSGALGIKAFWEDGFGPAKDLPVPSDALLRELVSAAQAHDLPLLLHASSEDAQRAGLETGVSGFAHGLWTWDDAEATALTESVREILDAVIARQIGWQPTIQVLYGERDLFDPDYLERPDVRAVVPASVIEWYRSRAGQWLADEMRPVPYVASLLAEGRWQDIDAQPIAHVMLALGYLAERDARLLFGTDTPSAPTYANPAGLNARLEMDHWIAAGVTPTQLFKAATLTNAEFLGLDDEIGTVEVGKRADLLLLDASPLESVTAYDTISTVIVAGRVIERSTLAADQ